MCSCRWNSTRPRPIELPLHSVLDSTASAPQCHNFAHAIFLSRSPILEGSIYVRPDSIHGCISIDSTQETPLPVKPSEWAVVLRQSEQAVVAHQYRSTATGTVYNSRACCYMQHPACCSLDELQVHYQLGCGGQAKVRPLLRFPRSSTFPPFPCCAFPCCASR